MNKKDDERIYPCSDCGKLRSKNEGGTVFTVCDECWDKIYKKPKLDQSIAEQVLVGLKDDLAELSQQIRALPDGPILNLGDEVLHKIVAKTAEIKDAEREEWQADYTDKIAARYEKRVAEIEAECQARIEALIEACQLALDFFTEYDVKNKVISGLSLKLNEALKATYTSKEKNVKEKEG